MSLWWWERLAQEQHDWDEADWEFEDAFDDDERREMSWKKWCRWEYRRPEWKAYVAEKCKERRYCCEVCRRCGGDKIRGEKLTVHHDVYEHGLHLWEADDENVRVVHDRRCHRIADRERKHGTSGEAEFYLPL